jgi:hypothetical protein
MPKTLSKDSIIEALSKLSENDLMEVMKAGAEEAQKRDEALELQEKQISEKRAIIKNGAK